MIGQLAVVTLFGAILGGIPLSGPNPNNIFILPPVVPILLPSSHRALSIYLLIVVLDRGLIVEPLVVVGI